VNSSGREDFVKKFGGGLTFINADNVKNNYASDWRQPYQFLSYAEFPNVRLPFKKLVLEYGELRFLIKQIHEFEGVSYYDFCLDWLKPRCGIWASAYDVYEGELLNEAREGRPTDYYFYDSIYEHTRDDRVFFLGSQYEKKTYVVEITSDRDSFTAYYMHDEQGKIINLTLSECSDSGGGSSDQRVVVFFKPGFETPKQRFVTVHKACHDLFYAISLMHCKNVQTEQIDPNAQLPRRVREHWEKKGKPALTKYYTLKIDPMCSSNSPARNSNASGANQAFHIKRGHFKDYRNSKGLFGKYKGLFWWPESVSGNAQFGAIEKDYEIVGAAK
jgi:hypothetical protein